APAPARPRAAARPPAGRGRPRDRGRDGDALGRARLEPAGRALARVADGRRGLDLAVRCRARCRRRRRRRRAARAGPRSRRPPPRRLPRRPRPRGHGHHLAALAGPHRRARGALARRRRLGVRRGVGQEDHRQGLHPRPRRGGPRGRPRPRRRDAGPPAARAAPAGLRVGHHHEGGQV
ncbi:MAG: hypothetical protein AVDCRST_MAG54-2873, partial [uncultured Actinomycetospora sp.]